MIRTPFCDLMGIDAPIMCAPFGPWDQVELAAAVCNAGALGSLGTAVRPVEDLRRQWSRLRDLTDRPFTINHTMRPLDEAAFAASLTAHPAAISFHIGVPADLIARAHDAGILWIQQVIDLAQAEAALEAGADVLIAQGGEAGGHGGTVATIVAVPQVVDLAGETPVLAAGGIATGRGLAAALVLGAQGVNMGTRFLASTEMNISRAWKQRLLDARAEDAVKVLNSERIMPSYSRPVAPTSPRSLTTPLVEALATDPDSIDAAAVGQSFLQAVLAGGGEQYLAFAGQSVGLIDEVLPVAEIIHRTTTDAARAISHASSYVDQATGTRSR